MTKPPQSGIVVVWHTRRRKGGVMPKWKEKTRDELACSVQQKGMELHIKSDYSTEFVTLVKGIPGARWLPEVKVWTVPQYRAEALAQILAQCYGEVEWDVPDTKVEAGPLSEVYAALCLLPGAPVQVVDAAYRAMAKLHHPDAGGEPVKMAHINLSYQAIKASVRKEV